MRYLVDGANAYPAMLEAIGQALRSIVMESYIFRSDATGTRFLDALCERAKAGVQVCILVDGFGSADTPASFWAPLVAAGGRAAVFRPLRFLPWNWTRQLMVRDHRKLLSVDDRVAFVGGINIGNEYAPRSWGGNAWHDAHVCVLGPAARELTKVFNRTWRSVTGENRSAQLAPAVRAGGLGVQLLESRLTRRRSMRKAYLQAIHNAKHTIRITNAYFIPDRLVRRALRGACRRGVDVQLLFAGATDVKVVQYASRALYQKLMRFGVQIYEWTERILHAKTAVIDGSWCTIGSFNLDRRSFLHNLEVNVAFVDDTIGAQIDAQFQVDIARSQRIDPATWHRRSPWQKLIEKFFYQLRYFL